MARLISLFVGVLIFRTLVVVQLQRFANITIKIIAAIENLNTFFAFWSVMINDLDYKDKVILITNQI